MERKFRATFETFLTIVCVRVSLLFESDTTDPSYGWGRWTCFPCSLVFFFAIFPLFSFSTYPFLLTSSMSLILAHLCSDLQPFRNHNLLRYFEMCVEFHCSHRLRCSWLDVGIDKASVGWWCGDVLVVMLSGGRCRGKLGLLLLHFMVWALTVG
ncbi:hypothetical protein DVH24_009646 [Malus domestica]|uniref:Uncharacterized protein n=1 Tax=Malus domestica TaxID=3750 RepID=A0A498JSK2_MALDO|nr:hypothetical protein DVH24_009646 [Malus domestica]